MADEAMDGWVPIPHRQGDPQHQITDWNGVPPNRECDGWHWLAMYRDHPSVWEWNAARQMWSASDFEGPTGWWSPSRIVEEGWGLYVAPCVPPELPHE